MSLRVPWVLLALGGLAACQVIGSSAEDAGVPGKAIGESCRDGTECLTGQCHGAMPDGSCTFDDCSTCPSGSACHVWGDWSYCFKECSAPEECREGYQCFAGVCFPPCQGAPDCEPDHVCSDGACVPKPSTGPCIVDSACATDVCLMPERRCSHLCAAPAECASNEVCTLREIESGGRYIGVRAVCALVRAGRATGAACALGTECRTGLCHVGVCTEVCREGSCPGDLACLGSQYVLPDRTERPIEVCLPAAGTFTWDLGGPVDGVTERLPVPANAVSVTIVLRAAATTDYAMMGLLMAPDKTVLFSLNGAGATPDGFYTQPNRFMWSNGVSAMLVPNTPEYPLQRAGTYRHTSLTTDAQGNSTGKPDVQIVYKVSPTGEVSGGTLNLNFYVADMAGHYCGSLSAATAPGNRNFQAYLALAQSIFGQAGIEFGAITYQTLRADLATVAYDGPDLDNLFASSAGQTARGVNVFVVKSIDPGEVLGVAGGIPGPPVHGTVKSGVVVSWANGPYCYNVFGNVLAHEIGHFVGLFHNVEQDGNHGNIPDVGASDQNLMYWNEQGGLDLSAGQAFVMLKSPLVE